MINALTLILSRPRTILTMMLVMVISGIISYVSLPKEANPDIDVPVYYISVSQQGVSPTDSERLLVRPMETHFRGLDGLKEITTVASLGHAGAILEFTLDTDADDILADIRDKADQVAGELPDDANDPRVFETNFALQPTLVVTLSGNVPERTLYNLARRLKDEVEAISSVREVKLSGHREEILEVILDLAKLESYDLTQNELLSALNRNNRLVAAGFIDDGTSRFNLKVPGLIETHDDVRNIVVKQNGEAVVQLSDISTIRRTFQDASSFTRVNGEPAISLEVTKRIGSNIIINNDTVRDVVNEYTTDWPSSVKINYLLDRSDFIFEMQGSLQASIMTAISLVMIIVVATLGLRNGLLVGLSIPISFSVGFMILGIFGMTINMMLLFGMVLTVGMLVDGAIVVSEYAHRKLTEGMPPTEAYRRAAQLMFWPVLSSTATTLAAFLPLLLWPGVPGKFMSYLPIMVIIVLSASLMTALVFLPVCGTLSSLIASRLSRNYALACSSFTLFSLTILSLFQPFLSFFYLFFPSIIVSFFVYRFCKRLESRLASFFPDDSSSPDIDSASLMYSIEGELDISKAPFFMRRYLTFLSRLCGSLRGNLLVIAVVIVSSFIIFSQFGSRNSGVEFFVEEEPDITFILVSARGNISAYQAADYVGEVESILLNTKGIDNIVMNASVPGTRGGADLRDVPPDLIGTLQVEMTDFCCRRPAKEIFTEILSQTDLIAGINVEIRELERGPPTGKDINLQVTGSNYDDVLDAVIRLRRQFEVVPGIQDIEDSRPLPGIEWELTVDRERAGRYNADITAIGSMIQLATTGVLIGTYRPDDSQDELDIRVRLPESERSFEVLQDLRLRTQNGQVPLSNFIARRPVNQIGSITRRDGVYSMSLKANLQINYEENGRVLTPTDKVNELQSWIDSQSWSDTISLRFRGADEEQQESFLFLLKAAGIALFLMFVILVTQFNSFYQTIITLLTVVLAIDGVLIGLMFMGQKFSVIMTGTGVVALAGIVVNNAIVLIDTYNRMLSEGVPRLDAILKTSAQRLRPILLTTITTIFGLLPMVLQINMDYFARTINWGDGAMWVPMSTAVIFGLAFSTLLTLVMIPTLLAFPMNLFRFFGRFSSGDSASSGSESGSESGSVSVV